MLCRPVVPGGAGDAIAPPDFGRSVNPISTKGGRLCPPNNTGTPGFSDLPTALEHQQGTSAASSSSLIPSLNVDRRALGLSPALAEKFISKIAKTMKLPGTNPANNYPQYGFFPSAERCVLLVSFPVDLLLPWQRTFLQDLFHFLCVFTGFFMFS